MTELIPAKLIKRANTSIHEMDGGGMYAFTGHGFKNSYGKKNTKEVLFCYKQAGCSGKPLKNGMGIYFTRDQLHFGHGSQFKKVRLIQVKDENSVVYLERVDE